MFNTAHQSVVSWISKDNAYRLQEFKTMLSTLQNRRNDITLQIGTIQKNVISANPGDHSALNAKLDVLQVEERLNIKECISITNAFKKLWKKCILMQQTLDNHSPSKEVSPAVASAASPAKNSKGPPLYPESFSSSSYSSSSSEVVSSALTAGPSPAAPAIESSRIYSSSDSSSSVAGSASTAVETTNSILYSTLHFTYATNRATVTGLIYACMGTKDRVGFYAPWHKYVIIMPTIFTKTAQFLLEIEVDEQKKNFEQQFDRTQRVIALKVPIDSRIISFSFQIVKGLRWQSPAPFSYTPLINPVAEVEEQINKLGLNTNELESLRNKFINLRKMKARILPYKGSFSIPATANGNNRNLYPLAGDMCSPLFSPSTGSGAFASNSSTCFTLLRPEPISFTSSPFSVLSAVANAFPSSADASQGKKRLQDAMNASFNSNSGNSAAASSTCTSSFTREESDQMIKRHKPPLAAIILDHS